MIQNNATKTRWLRIDSRNRESMDSMLALVKTVHGAEIKEMNGVKYVRFVEDKLDRPTRKTSTWRVFMKVVKKQSERNVGNSSERQYCAVIMK